MNIIDLWKCTRPLVGRNVPMEYKVTGIPCVKRKSVHHKMLDTKHLQLQYYEKNSGDLSTYLQRLFVLIAYFFDDWLDVL